MMELEIKFKTGHVLQMDALDYSPGEIRAWVSRNLTLPDETITGYVVFNDCLVNVNEILYVKEIKEGMN